MLDEAKLWDAVQRRDRAMDGQFVYGVVTTGVFCRPGCPSRAPRRNNVRFYPSAEQAQAAGLRACLRCRPVGAGDREEPARWEAVGAFLRLHLEEPEALKLGSLSRRFGMSPFHLQRMFKAAVGITPRQYVESLRLQRFKQDLKAGAPVTEAIYSAGFGSSSRVYSRVDARLGMTPKQYRAGGQAVPISYVPVETVLGWLMLAATDRGLCFVEFGPSPDELVTALQREFPAAICVPLAEPYTEEFRGWRQALTDYLEGSRVLQAMPVSLQGTAFQCRVWTYLQTIPAGSVRTYAGVAAAIGQPRAVRAVASVCAANRLALVVPCHRVIRGDGGLGGYRWGLERKQALLNAERRWTAGSEAATEETGGQKRDGAAE